MTAAELYDTEDLLATDFEYYCSQVLRIKTKSGEVIPFVWNDEQRYLARRVKEQYEKQGYVRLLILKGRQWGGSTWVEARGYARTSRNGGETGLVMAHDIPATTNLFEMSKLMLDHDEYYSPQIKQSNEKALVFREPENSRLIVRTAPKSKGGAGRSFNFRFVHASEVAYWGEMGQAAIGGLMQAVPREHPSILGTEVYWETTANGYDPVFYAKWEEVSAAERDGVPTEWATVFIPWYWHTAYTHELSQEQQDYIMRTLTKDEAWLMRQKRLDGRHVTTGQLSWRRQTIADSMPPPGLTKLQFFRQEYPATPTEAFQATGSHIFDLAQVNLCIEDAPEPEIRYEIQPNGNAVAREDGRLLVWKEPDPMRAYVLGVDVAEGLPHGDWSCIKVIDHHTGDEVASWHGDIHPSELGRTCVGIARRYNGAWIGVERNNHGLTTITKILETDYPVRRVYVEHAVDTPGAKPRKRYGWVTTKKSKPLMVDGLVQMMSESPTDVKDRETFREMLRFERHEDGTYGAQEGFNDDRLIAMSIARELRRRLPTPRQEATKIEENRPRAPSPVASTGQSANERWKAFTK